MSSPIRDTVHGMPRRFWIERALMFLDHAEVCIAEGDDHGEAIAMLRAHKCALKVARTDDDRLYYSHCIMKYEFIIENRDAIARAQSRGDLNARGGVS